MTSVRLVPYEARHAPRLFEAACESVAEVGPWLPWCHAGYAIEEAAEWIGRQMELFRAGEEFQFAIESEAGDYLGGCGLNRLGAETHSLANLGYWVRTGASGRGVAPAAVAQLAAWAFAETALLRLEIVVAVGNRRSRRVAERAGARYEGRLRSRLLLHGEPHDAFLYSLVRERV